MANEFPDVPAGSGEHPIVLVVISANNMGGAAGFYAKVFGWQGHAMSAELTAMVTPAGPSVALRSNVPAGFPGMVPYIKVSDVDRGMKQVEGAGGTTERAAWNIPMVGRMARFKDASGTIYGLTNGEQPQGMTRILAPLGKNPKPAEGTVCSLEMYAKDVSEGAKFFAEQFGWGTLPTMSQYMGFDPGLGVGGVFQSHTPSLPALAYIYVGDVKVKLGEIEANGGKKLSEAMSMPGMGTFGYFTDPSGTSMGLIGA